MCRAVDDGLLPRNPAEGVPLPKLERKEVTGLTGAEVGRLLRGPAATGRRSSTLAALGIDLRAAPLARLG